MLFSVVCALSVTPALAQEIGTEIPPEQQKTTPPQGEFEDPFARSGQAGQPTAARRPAGPRAGAFGLRATFGGSPFPALAPTTTGGPIVITIAPAQVPTFSFRYQASEAVGLVGDLGFALGLANRMQLGFGVGAGLEIYLGAPTRPLRALIVGGAAFSKPLARADDETLFVTVNAGFGAEYWFADEFSVQGRMLIGAPINLAETDAIPIATFTPGLAGTFHF